MYVPVNVVDVLTQRKAIVKATRPIRSTFYFDKMFPSDLLFKIFKNLTKSPSSVFYLNLSRRCTLPHQSDHFDKRTIGIVSRMDSFHEEGDVTNPPPTQHRIGIRGAVVEASCTRWKLPRSIAHFKI